MDYTLDGENVEITDALRAWVGEKLDTLNAGLATDTLSAQVTLKAEGSEHHALGILWVDGVELSAVPAVGPDVHVAVNRLVDKLSAQLRRHTQRMYGRPK
ncbi:HPF/RaiA family ribosome-associated protein [Streptomyces lavendulae]|uniref:Ribosome hibernation promoting factor n=2 Tax=Streptomyces lavendulae TaxID=1914 RepID=A0A2K8P914_STRLA|nr:HPF/RaiA family ribosome-associated protein [Streptomyces lavendulae]ATZ22243.1 Ribosome hibernation promoting factor [Streptomyces lavendulae subsp. lavendulae]